MFKSLTAVVLSFTLFSSPDVPWSNIHNIVVRQNRFFKPQQIFLFLSLSLWLISDFLVCVFFSLFLFLFLFLFYFIVSLWFLLSLNKFIVYLLPAGRCQFELDLQVSHGTNLKMALMFPTDSDKQMIQIAQNLRKNGIVVGSSKPPILPILFFSLMSLIITIIIFSTSFFISFSSSFFLLLYFSWNFCRILLSLSRPFLSLCRHVYSLISSYLVPFSQGHHMTQSSGKKEVYYLFCNR